MSKIFTRLFLINFVMLLITFLLLGWMLKLSQKEIFILWGVAILGSVILILIIERILIIPIIELQKAAHRIVQGDFKNRLNYSRKDELGALAKYLDHLAGDLQSKGREISQDKNELEAILAGMVEGVIVIGKNEKILLMNPPVTEMLDLRSNMVIGKTYWEVLRDVEINASIKEALTQRKSLRKEIRIVGMNESHFVMQISTVLTAPENLSAIVLVFHDITELKRLEKLRSEFVANVSHEFKTPLTTIRGFAETLQDGAIEDKAKAKGFLDIINKHAQRLEQLVNDLLTLSALESRETKLQYQKVNIKSIIDSVVLLCKDQLQNRQQKLELELPTKIPLVLGERIKLEQAFFNLLDNAIKFTPSQGRITIRVTYDHRFVKIEFQDTGIGIESQHLPRIFERFYRVDKGRSRQMGGTGLGLAIVKHIIQLHQGTISVQSEPEKGSTFLILLPQIVS